MKINSVKVVNLHGRISQSFSVKDGVNLLVGINGSGKTSVLKAITWLLAPSISDLCTNEFKELSISFRFKGISYKLRATQDGKEMRLELLKSGKKYLDPLVAPLRSEPSRYRKDIRSVEEAREVYLRLRPDEKELPLWNFIRELEEPHLVTVERRLHVNPIIQQEGMGYFNHAESQATPLDEAKKLSARAYAKYRSSLISLSTKLQNEIIISALEQGLVSLTRKARAPRKEKINLVETQSTVTKLFTEGYISQRTDSGFKDKVLELIQKYFTAASESLKQDNTFELANIQKLIDIFQSFEREAERSYQPVKMFLDILNDFFADSSKVLQFDGSSNQLCFSYSGELNSKGDITFLASGEQQIIILFSYVAFLNSGIILIDEPEVSLHPWWQEKFLNNVNALIPAGTQVIFATHSPAIVGREVKKVIALN